MTGYDAAYLMQSFRITARITKSLVGIQGKLCLGSVRAVYELDDNRAGRNELFFNFNSNRVKFYLVPVEV